MPYLPEVLRSKVATIETPELLADNTAPLNVDYAERSFWDTTPYNGDLVIIGAAAKRFENADSIAYALLDAARKVSFFYGLSGKVETMLDDTGNPLTLSRDVKTELNYESDYEKYIEDFEFDAEKDVLYYRDSVFVKVRFTPANEFNLNYSRSTKTDTALWITKPPDNISGYKVGIGRAAPHLFHKDTIIASYESAVAAIFNSVNSQLRSLNESVETNYYSSANITNVQISEAAVKHFYVLDIWEDPKDKSVWTLAIAKEFEEAADAEPAETKEN